VSYTRVRGPQDRFDGDGLLKLEKKTESGYYEKGSLGNQQVELNGRMAGDRR